MIRGRRGSRAPRWPSGGERQAGAGGRGAADAALPADLAAMGLGDVLDDGEAEAGPPLLAGAPLVDPVEALEDARDRLRGDADAGVAHLEHRLAATAAVAAGITPHADGDPAVRTVVLDGVVE